MSRRNRCNRDLTDGKGIADLRVSKVDGVLYLHSPNRGKCLSIPLSRVVAIEKDTTQSIEIDTGFSGDDSIYYGVNFPNAETCDAMYLRIMQVVTDAELPEPSVSEPKSVADLRVSKAVDRLILSETAHLVLQVADKVGMESLGAPDGWDLTVRDTQPWLISIVTLMEQLPQDVLVQWVNKVATVAGNAGMDTVSLGLVDRGIKIRRGGGNDEVRV